ncbi:MAG: histidinol dehydrogenase [Bacteroidales bacterium]|nr:histidinol dehydrogenase [Bacteroidales bacterium]
MRIYKYPNKELLNKILQRPYSRNKSVEATVLKIINDVKNNGDKAVKKYTFQFDKTVIKNTVIDISKLKSGELNISTELKKSIRTAINNITKFHKSQKPVYNKTETSRGVYCWQKSVPVEKIGIYIPGGSAPLFSTVLMLGIPAKIAGCKEIVLCTPPDKRGNINPVILFTCREIGIKYIYKVGGAQAIAAMAYGTETIPKAYKIFGPGNQYVTIAKQIVSTDGVAIDIPAGPSEVTVIADKSANPEFIVYDLLSQAEHGPDSQVLLISNDESIIKKVVNLLPEHLNKLPRKEFAKKSIENSPAILVKDISEAIEISNEYAPEHLILSVINPEKIAEKIINAGSVFLGNYTPESAGDYASGTNHVLPTNGYAKSFSGVNLDSFMKKITFQSITPEGLKNIGNAIEQMAEAEGLKAHKEAVIIRFKKP